MLSRVRAVLMVSLALVMVLLSGCSAVTSSREEPTPTPIPPPPVPEKPTYTVNLGEVVDSLSFTGRVAPSVEEELYFREAGRVKTVYVERNDFVEANTLLAELENDDLVRQLTQSDLELEAAGLNLARAEQARQYTINTAEINLRIQKLQMKKMEDSLASLDLDAIIAKANFVLAQKGPSAEDVEIAQRQVEQAKNSLWSAQVGRDSTCGQTDGSACDSAQASVQRSEESVHIAELSLQKLLKPMSQEDLDILEANYEKTLQKESQTRLDLDIQEEQVALKELELDKLRRELDPQLTKAVERAKLSVERLRAQVEDTRVFSPIAGKVTSVSAYEGRTINAYSTVFVVADEAELEITSEPMSSQLQRLSEGMAASVILSSYPGKELPAEIITLPYPYGGGGGASVEEADKLTHIAFDPEDLDIEPGDLVKVIVTLEKKDAALWLSPAAIRTFAGRKFVVVQEEGSQRRADITIGIESTERIEILDGLEEGQIVIGQ